MHQLAKLGRWLSQNETGIIVLRRGVFVAPEAARGQVNDLLAAFAGRDFQPQIEIHADHQWQLTDEHQPVFGNIAQKTDRFVGDAVEHSEEIRQLMPFDPAVGKHAQFAMQGSITEPRFASERTRTTGPLSPLPV